MWQIIGFEKNKSFFEKAVTDQSLNHAYLFSGPEMIGKRTFALELAHQLGENSDIIYLDPADSESGKTISIAEIRKIKNFMSFSPFASKYKFAIINDAHLMTEEAQNALLKILEEPSSSSLLILITASPSLLLPTVASRCQEINFLPHSKQVIADILKNSKIPLAGNELLPELTAGKIGLIFDILKNNSFDELKKSIEQLADLAKADLEEKFAFALKISDDKNRPDLEKKILYWILYARTRLEEPKIRRILKELLVLNKTIVKPQYNLRLALENFLIQI